jgi:putative transposase
MPQSLDSILLHVVFSVKNREPLLGPAVLGKLFPYLDGAIHAEGCVCLKAGGVSNHVHLAIRLSRTITVATLMERVKSNSSKWLKTQDESLRDFAWQRGYGAFSVGHRDLPALVQYIEGQEAHHRGVGYQDEFRLLLAEHGIEGDERYMWD